MSVLIKGMGLPEKCAGCILEDLTDCGHECFLMYDEGCTNGVREFGRLKNCPLTGIPEKHGDLIDKNKLKHEMFFNFTGDRIPMYDCDDNPTKTTYRNVERIINEQPAVIEAGGVEE